jgi:NAD(P)-dependent dehydrogenase (short-subunit alcohol dehydrogenase family)
MTMETDVSRIEDLQRLEAAARKRFGGADLLMNNGGVQPGGGVRSA